jgi:hypothetical protein
MKKNKFRINRIMRKRIFLFLVIFFFNIFNIYCQEAEKLYHSTYSKLSLVLQPSLLKANYASNNDGSVYPNMIFRESNSIQFGFYYNFAQSGNFNFKTGIIAKDFSPSFDLNISNEDIGLNTNYLLTDYKPYSQFIICLPIKTEYLFPVSSKFNLSFGANINLNLITGVNEEIVTRIFVSNDTDTKDIYYSKTDSQEKITFSSEISFGVQYKSKYALIQLDAYWTMLNLQTPITGQYNIYNLENSSDVIGNFNVDPNFYGLSLVISPRKGWLKKKK